MSEIDYARLRDEVEWWLEKRSRTSEAPVQELAGAAGLSVRRISAIRAGERCSLDTAERLLEAIDYEYGPKRHPTRGHFVGAVIRWSPGPSRKVRGDQVGRLKKLDFANAHLTYRQLRVVHEAHWKLGLSLRELARRYWRQWGYASEQACLNSLSDRLRECELPVRPRSEATALANTKRRLRGADETKAQYKARKRREAREADPEVEQAHRQRIEWLRAMYD